MAFGIAAIIGASVAGAGGLAKLGMSLAGRGDRIAEQNAAKEEMAKYKSQYENLDTSNLYADARNQYANIQTNFENTYEDLTVNQQQAQFQAQQGAQQRANIMQNMRGAAGGSGIAALAQAMANQGQLATQGISASIGQQESANQRLSAQGASRQQELERQAELQVVRGEEAAYGLRKSGAETARGLEYSKTGTLLGMSQQRVGAANQARAEAKAQQMSAVGDIANVGTQMMTAGMEMKSPGGGNIANDMGSFNSSELGQLYGTGQGSKPLEVVQQGKLSKSGNPVISGY